MMRDGVAYKRARLQTRHAPKIIIIAMLIIIIVIILIIINFFVLIFYVDELVIGINSSYIIYKTN